MTDSYKAQAIIFDLDGTLIDSAEELRAILNLILGGLGLRSIQPSEIRSMIGDGVLKLIERGLTASGGGPLQAEALYPRFIELYENNPTAHTRCYPGVAETLAMLHGRGFCLAVVTNKPIAVTTKILRSHRLADVFKVVIGGDVLPQRKPDPTPLLEAARRLDLPVSRLLMVGDNVHDVEAARAAGMRSIAVTYGYHHRPPQRFGADCLIDRFEELLELVGSPMPPAA
jgi:phosphoglycolate phosphatase